MVTFFSNNYSYLYEVHANDIADANEADRDFLVAVRLCQTVDESIARKAFQDAGILERLGAEHVEKIFANAAKVAAHLAAQAGQQAEIERWLELERAAWLAEMEKREAAAERDRDLEERWDEDSPRLQ